MTCSNCGGIAYCRGLCRPCYVFKLRTGRDRPEELVIRLERRRFLRVLLREAKAS